MTHQRSTKDPARNSVPPLRADANVMAQRTVPSTEIRPGVESPRPGNPRRGVAWLASMLVAASLSFGEVSAADRALQNRPDGHRLVAGTDAVLRDADSADVCLVFDAIPVASNRPHACTIVSGAGTNSVTLAGNDCEIEIEVFLSNYACMGINLRTWQATLGGDSGGGLDSALPAGISRPAAVPCSAADATGDAECIAAGYQPSSPVGGCGDSPDPSIFVCATATQDRGRATDMLFEFVACSQTRLSCGSASTSGGEPDPGGLVYGMTVAFHVDAGVTGTVTIPFRGPDKLTFAQFGFTVPIPIGQPNDAVLNIPLGRCCNNLNGTCTENVTLNFCSIPELWDEGVACPQNGGPGCADCVVGEDNGCSDGDACTLDFCNPDTLLCNRVETPPIGPNECCDPANNSRTFFTSPCADNFCTLGDNRGVVASIPDGSTCDDSDECTAFDECASGVCDGQLVDGTACIVDADCNLDGTTPSATCIALACNCAGPAQACCLSSGDCVELTFRDCTAQNGTFSSAPLCTPDTCNPSIPTVSEWGLVVMTLLLLVGAKVYFNGRYAVPA